MSFRGHHGAVAYEQQLAERDAALPASMRDYGLLMWGDDADIGASVVSAADCITRIRTRGSVSYAATGPYMLEPATTRPPVIGTQNGRQCPVFTAGRSLVAQSQTAFAPLYTTGTSCTVSIYIRIDAGGADARIFANRNLSASVGLMLMLTSADRFRLLVGDGANTLDLNSGATGYTSGVHRVDVTKNGLAYAVRVNGAAYASGSASALVSSGSSTQNVFIGSNPGDGNNPLQGSVLCLYYHPSSVIPDTDLDGDWNDLLESVWVP